MDRTSKTVMHTTAAGQVESRFVTAPRTVTALTTTGTVFLTSY